MSHAHPQDHPNPVLIDTDIGDDIDDALALALALNSPEIELLGVTTVFGDTILRARLAAHILHIYGRANVPNTSGLAPTTIYVGRGERSPSAAHVHRMPIRALSDQVGERSPCTDDDKHPPAASVPVAAGIAMPIKIRHAPSGVPQAALLGKEAEAYTLSDCNGPELIIKTALAYPNMLTLLCLGPLTNVATALQKEPRLATTLRRIIFIGGTRRLPFPEWNVRSDIAAAHIVLASGVHTTLIGWNITRRCQLGESDLQKLSMHGTEQTKLLSQLIAIWQRHRPRWHPPMPYLHDPLAVVALCMPEFLTFQEMKRRSVMRGPFRGFVVPEITNGPEIEVAVGVKVEEVRKWIMERLLLSV